MMTSSNGNIFRLTGHLCGEFTVPGDFPAQRPVTRSFNVFFELRLNKRLSKQSRGWWFETLLRPLWRHCNAIITGWATWVEDMMLTLVDNDDLLVFLKVIFFYFKKTFSYTLQGKDRVTGDQYSLVPRNTTLCRGVPQRNINIRK